MHWVWALAGAVISAPLWAGLAMLFLRRRWRLVKRLSERTKARQHFIEVGHLVGGLAHEIKNPLSTINVNLKLLAEDLADYDDEEHRRWLRRLQGVQTEAARVREILDDFLRFAGKVELSRQRCDLRRVVEELIDFFGPQAESAGVLLRASLPEQPLWAKIDEKLIKQALLNLMINAAEAMEDAESRELLVRLSGQRRVACIEVIDTGPGMDAETRERIFQAYFSTKPRGSGLGLPTSRRIVQEHGGRLLVESEPGKGTRFCIELPPAE